MATMNAARFRAYQDAGKAAARTAPQTQRRVSWRRPHRRMADRSFVAPAGPQPMAIVMIGMMILSLGAWAGYLVAENQRLRDTITDLRAQEEIRDAEIQHAQSPIKTRKVVTSNRYVNAAPEKTKQAKSTSDDRLSSLRNNKSGANAANDLS